MYDYVERSGLPKLRGEHRSFCTEILNANKYYSREDIQTMSDIFGYDVFKFGGRFYRHPGPKGQTDEECRHRFKPVFVTKNNN